MARKQAAGSKGGSTGRRGKQRPAAEEKQAAEGRETKSNETGGVAKEKKKRPIRCIRLHTDMEFRREFPLVCEGLLNKAKAGGVRETRLLLDIGQFGDVKAARRRDAKSLSTMLLDELKRRQDEREAAMDGTAAGNAGAEMSQSSGDAAVLGAMDGNAEDR